MVVVVGMGAGGSSRGRIEIKVETKTVQNLSFCWLQRAAVAADLNGSDLQRGHLMVCKIFTFTKGNLLQRNLQSPRPELLRLSPEGKLLQFLDFPKRENLSGPRLLSPAAAVLICVATACLCVTAGRLKGGDKSFRL